MSTMSQRSHLTDSEAWRVVGRLEEGQNQAEVAQAIGVLQSVISRIWNRFLETGNAGRRPGQGRRRATTPNEDRYFSVNGSETPKYERYSSPTTPLLGYWHHGFNSDYPKPAPWCRSVCSPTSVLVHGGISIDGRTDLYIIRDGPLTARRYSDEILRPIVVPYTAAIGDDLILIDDNCRPHRANLVEDFLFEEGIVRMEWPASSPDMNPIQHVWDALGRRVAGHQSPPQTLQELERALLEEWDRIPQLVINSLIDSMPQMCSALLAVRGNHNPY
ncbi:transposable element Tcb2 transposase [Trichonephila clavipes]|nr:transposable element Tcb2 transposase [Trichonephila clavipes]